MQYPVGRTAPDDPDVGSNSADPQLSAEKGTWCTCEMWNEEAEGVGRRDQGLSSSNPQSHTLLGRSCASSALLWTCPVFWIASSGGKLSEDRAGLEQQSSFHSVSADKREVQMFNCQEAWALRDMVKGELNTAVQSHKLEHPSSIQNQGLTPV